MYQVLGKLFSEAETAEIAPIAYFCEGLLLPAFEGTETGMGERNAAHALAVASKRSVDEVNQTSSRLGDLGLAAEKLITRSRPQLSLTGVYETLLQIARTAGRGSTEEKQKLLAALLARATPLEGRYIIRLTLGRLRLGVGSPTLIEAAARLEEDRGRARQTIERSFNLCSDLGLVLTTLFEEGLAALEKFKVRVGNPVRPMLAERLPSAEKIIDKIGACAVEAKLDGLRCQIHLKGRSIEIFSRNLERTTAMFPDIVAAVRQHFEARSAIIDGEALAVNEETGEFHPFQVTAQRKRKHGIEQMTEEFPLHLVAFDLLYADGRDLTRRSYHERRAALKARIKHGSKRLHLSEGETVETPNQLQAFFDREVELGHEGVIAKRLDAGYEPGARNYNWIKLKRAYRSELNDTIDVCIIGYLRGRGARARFGIGSLLGAAYDEQTDTFKTIGKIGSGLSDADWVRMRKVLDAWKVNHRPARVDSRLQPDMWIEPKVVVTVLADELTRSPINTAALDDQGRGLALRFPRIIGFVREDKAAEDATTTEELRKMFAQQSKGKRSRG